VVGIAVNAPGLSAIVPVAESHPAIVAAAVPDVASVTACVATVAVVTVSAPPTRSFESESVSAPAGSPSPVPAFLRAALPGRWSVPDGRRSGASIRPSPSPGLCPDRSANRSAPLMAPASTAPKPLPLPDSPSPGESPRRAGMAGPIGPTEIGVT
jgi:hypothetical protein